MTDDPIRDEAVEPQFEQESENEALVFYQGPRIRNQDELIEKLNIDLDVWEPYKSKVKPFQAQAKREFKNLEIVDGVTTGTIDTGGMIIATLYSVEVWFARRQPNPIHPLIVPAWPAATYPLPDPPQPDGLRRAIIAGDAQIGFERVDDHLRPFHDRKALDIFLQIARDANPDEIHIVGDFLDLPESSTHFARSPEMHLTTQPAIFEAHLWLAWLRALLPDAQIVLYEGNHEQRIPESVGQYLPWAYGLKRADTPYEFPVMSVPYLLGLKGMGIEWLDGYPDAVHWLDDNRICLEHGATTKLKAKDHVRFRGHDHRIGVQSRTVWGPEGKYYVMEIGTGCLSTTRAPGRQKREDWQEGFTVLDYAPQGSVFSFDPVIIERDQAIWDGKLYHGRDRGAGVRRAYPGLAW
jgi:hypothetical protein